MTTVVDREALRAAAWRLKHDVGKAIRWGAPAEPEEDAEKLRARLRADVLETRREAKRPVSVSEMFARWHDREGSAFEGTPLAGGIEEVAALLRDVETRASRLAELDEAGLRSLDTATREVADACARFHQAALADGPR